MQPPLGPKPNRPVEGKQEKIVRRLPLSRQLTEREDATEWVTGSLLLFQV